MADLSQCFIMQGICSRKWLADVYLLEGIRTALNPRWTNSLKIPEALDAHNQGTLKQKSHKTADCLTEFISVFPSLLTSEHPAITQDQWWLCQRKVLLISLIRKTTSSISVSHTSLFHKKCLSLDFFYIYRPVYPNITFNQRLISLSALLKDWKTIFHTQKSFSISFALIKGVITSFHSKVFLSFFLTYWRSDYLCTQKSSSDSFASLSLCFLLLCGGLQMNVRFKLDS